jgi:hypothetical protein
MRGASGALNPKSAYAGQNFLLRIVTASKNPFLQVKIGRYATNGYEPRQVRKEAAVNNAVCVVSTSNICL